MEAEYSSLLIAVSFLVFRVLLRHEILIEHDAFVALKASSGFNVGFCPTLRHVLTGILAEKLVYKTVAWCRFRLMLTAGDRI